MTDPLRLDLDAREITVMANPQVPLDAEPAQVGFGGLDLAQVSRRDRQTVRHTRRETRRGGGVPVGQAQIPGQIAHILFGQAGFRERRADRGGRPRGPAGPVFAQVVGVGAVADDGEPACPRFWNEPAP